MKLHDFMTSPELCGESFTDSSWAIHREVLARLWDGDAHLIQPEHLPAAYELLGVEMLPSEAPDEFYLAFGRGSGKTRFGAVAAVHAWAQDYRSRGLAAGACATVSAHCPSKKQAAEWLDYCRGFIEASPILREAVGKDAAECIESTHGTRLELFTSNFRAVRGFTMAFAFIDEAAWLHDEFSALPDVELRHALLPALNRLRPAGRLLVASSLHRRAGLMFEMHKRHFAKAAA